MTRRPVLALLIALAVGACTDAAGDPPDTTVTTLEPAPPVTTTLTPLTTTTATTTTVVPGTTATDPGVDPNAPDPAAATGLGDSLYPTLGNTGYDVDHYTLDLVFDPDAGHLEAVATIEATAVEDLEVFSVDFIGFEVSDVTVDDAAATTSRAPEKLVIGAPTPLPAGESFTVAIAYEGTPRAFASEAIGLSMGWISAVTGEQYVVAEPDGARTWFPANDHPLDTATFTFRITVPDSLLAVANGVLADTIAGDDGVTRVYEMEQPMATYLATVVIGDYVSVADPNATADTDVPIRNVLPPDVAADPPSVLAEQGSMVAFLEELFGPYPFDLYGIAVVPGFAAALENSTLSLFGDDIFGSNILETVLVHELAHQWFGDHVTLGDWGDMWLNEGFATYAEWLWIEETEGAAALEDTVTESHRFMSLAGLPPPGAPPADDLFNASVYFTGALTLHALRLEIGDESFFTTLRTYVDRFGGDTVRTADFVAVAEEVSATELDDLFDAWLFGDTLPDL